MTLHAVTLAAEEVVDLTDAPNSQLMLAAILGIAAVVLLITLARPLDARCHCRQHHRTSTHQPLRISATHRWREADTLPPNS